MSRFEEPTQEAEEILNEVIEENFPILEGAAIKVLFDSKKKKSGGKYEIARIQKCNELMRHLSADNIVPNGRDYIMYIDKNVWNEIPRADKKRLMFHELCHTDVDFEKNDPYKIRSHSIEGFHEEMDYNSDDPKWGERLAQVAESIYEKDE